MVWLLNSLENVKVEDKKKDCDEQNDGTDTGIGWLKVEFGGVWFVFVW